MFNKIGNKTNSLVVGAWLPISNTNISLIFISIKYKKCLRATKVKLFNKIKMIMVPRQTKRAINSIDDSTWAVLLFSIYFFFSCLFLLYLCVLLLSLRLVYFGSTSFFIHSSVDYMFLIKFHFVSLKMIFSRHKQLT